MAEKPETGNTRQPVRQPGAITDNPSHAGPLEKLFDLSLDMLCVADFDGYFRILNTAFEITLGYSRERLLKTPFIDFVHPDDVEATNEALKRLTTGEKVICFENRYRCRDGSYRWLEWTSVPVTGERFIYAVARDITGQKAIQEELAAQRDLFDHVLANVPASIFWKDRNSTFLGCNNRFARDAGLESPEAIAGKTDYDLAWTRSESDFYRECDRMVMNTGEPMLNIEESQQQADGSMVHILTNKVPLTDPEGNVTGMLGIYMDITKLKQTEAVLIKSESRLRTLFDSAAEFIFVIDPEGKILNANRYVHEHAGYGADEVIGRNIKEFFTPESQLVCDCNFPGLRERGYNRADIEFVCKDGHIIDMECSATAVPDETGAFTTFLIIQRDVTERKRAATALANSEHRFRAIFNSTYQLIGVLDTDGILLDANQTALDFAGLAREDAIGVPFWDIECWGYAADVQERIRAAVRRAAQGTPVSYEENLLAGNGELRTIDVTLTPVTDQQGGIALIIPEGRDISEQKRAEEERQRHHEELAHVNRLSTMGEMASGMAHELNQPLTAIVSYCGSAKLLAQSQPESREQLCDVLDRASEQAHRAGEIIRHLREFVGNDRNQRQTVDLDQLVADLDILVGSELRNAGVRLERQPGARGCRVKANKVQLEQVLVNLIRNSIEAMHDMPADEGRILVRTRLLEDREIEVTVSDNGHGIDGGMTLRLFHPFQTSKTSGMGMGLSISRSIIEAHGGRIWADPDVPEGATIGFSLPVCY